MVDRDTSYHHAEYPLYLLLVGSSNETDRS